MRGQMSVEFVIVIAVTLGLVITGLVFFITTIRGESGAVTSQRITDIGRDTISAAKQSYALGTGARQTLEVNLPDNIRRIYVNPSSPTELVIVYETDAGTSEAVFFSSVPLVTNDLVDNNVTGITTGIILLRADSLGPAVKLSVAGE